MSKPPSSNTSESRVKWADLPALVKRWFKEEPEVKEALKYLFRARCTADELFSQRWEQYPDKIRFLGSCYARLLAEAASIEILKIVVAGEGFEQDHIRDPDNICRAYVKGPRLSEATCEGDNHYLCGGCREHCIVSVDPQPK